jgi:hypothetical protein
VGDAAANVVEDTAAAAGNLSFIQFYLQS